jgi:tRNA(Ile)-lysidine synthase TilS/MesJ
MTEKKDLRYIDKIEKSVGRAINRYSLIAGGDRVAVALSGGKDSLVLLETLARRRRRLPVSYELFAVHVFIKNIGYESDVNFMREFCASLNVPFHLIEMEADLTIDESKSKCFVCSWHRRKALFNFAEEMNCRELALGHHLDDAIETLMMNMMYNGITSSLPPSLSMFSGKLQAIRPLILLEKNEIDKYAEIRRFPSEVKRCPYGEDTSRIKAHEMIQQMTSGSSAIKKSIFRSMSNIHREYLPPD